jgi:hypothetical protein
MVTATLAELNGDVAGALDALARLPAADAAHHPMREPAARLHVYLLVLAGRADEAVPIAEAVLRTSSHEHVRKTPPFVRWSAGDLSEIEVLRADYRELTGRPPADRVAFAPSHGHPLG